MPKFVGHISVPVYRLGERELAGLRMGMIETEGGHSFSTGSGLGTDGLWVGLVDDPEGKGKGRTTYYRMSGRDLLYGTAQLVRHPARDRFPHTDPNAEDKK